MCRNLPSPEKSVTRPFGRATGLPFTYCLATTGALKFARVARTSIGALPATTYVLRFRSVPYSSSAVSVTSVTGDVRISAGLAGAAVPAADALVAARATRPAALAAAIAVRTALFDVMMMEPPPHRAGSSRAGLCAYDAQPPTEG